MLSALNRLGLLLEVLAVAAAVDIPLNIEPIKGLQVTVSPDKGSIGISRRLFPAGLSSSSPLSQAPASSTLATPSSPQVTSISVPPLQFTGRIDVSMASVRELDSNLNMVSSTSPRFFNRFSIPIPGNVSGGGGGGSGGGGGGGGGGGAIAPPYDTPLPSSNSVAPANCQFAMNISLLQPLLNATFGLAACAVKTNAATSYGNETNQILAGQLSISLQMSSWPWTSYGAYIEFNVTVAVPIGRQLSPVPVPPSTNSPRKIMLGTNDSYVLFSTRATSQTTNPSYDSYQKMPPSYPMLVQNVPTNNVATIVLMLPRTPSMIVWTAVIEPGYGSQYKPASAGAASFTANASWMIQASAAALVGIIIGIWNTLYSI